MNATRKGAVEAVFKRLDKTGDGVVGVEDLKGVYSAKNHPKVKKGEATEDDLLKKFLNMFETNGSIDGKVNSGVTSFLLVVVVFVVDSIMLLLLCLLLFRVN